MTKPLGSMRAISWDIDGVHYPYDGFPGLFSLMDRACADVACRLLPELDHETSVRLSKISYRKYGECLGGYLDWVEEQGLPLDLAVFKKDLFHEYHREAWVRMLEAYPAQMAPEPKTIAAFKRASSFLMHGAATHSSIEAFTLPLLTQKELLPYFNRQAMVGMDEVEFRRKSSDIASVLLSVERMGRELGEAAFPEDTTGNLERAKETDSRITTVYVHHGKPLESVPSFIDHQVRNPRELVTRIAEGYRRRIWVPGHTPA